MVWFVRYENVQILLQNIEYQEQSVCGIWSLCFVIHFHIR